MVRIRMPKVGDGQGELPFSRAPAGAPEKAPEKKRAAVVATPAPAPSATPAPVAARAPAAQVEAEPEVLSVAKLDRLIKRVIEDATVEVLVRGEVSGLRKHASGHAYFSLKDEREPAMIDCVMYRSAPLRAHKQLCEGERVVLRGQVTLYAQRGRMQFVAEDVLQTARGALLEALEKLKRELAEEGLFDPARKKPLPRDPQRIAVLTSRSGAAIHDVVRVAFRRGGVHILLVPTMVQGAGAAGNIAVAIAGVDRLGLDAIIVTRGGGSAEDLAAYNDARVVRAIAAARTPIVSAVGHEIDTTLADLAADARAATPSQAAEMLVPDASARLENIHHLRKRLEKSLRHRINAGAGQLSRLQRRMGDPRRRVMLAAQQFDELERALESGVRRLLAERRQHIERAQRRVDARDPRRVLEKARLHIASLQPKLEAAMRGALTRRHNAATSARSRLSEAARRAVDKRRLELSGLAAAFDALSPIAVLARGYAIATRDGHVLSDAKDVAAGDAIDVRLHRGSVRAIVAEEED